jgi:hypothetical protein
VRVPDEAGTGDATITLSFADCAEAVTAPATVTVPVVAPERKADDNGK